MNYRKSLFTTVCITVLNLINPTASLAADNEFCYGPECPLPPEHWADKFPDCAGEKQSPIDISGVERNKRLPPIRFHYHPIDLVVENNGHTTEVTYEEDTSNYIKFGRQRCDLLQFHFHTRTEHNVGGGSFPMEAHLVHRCESGRLAVIGVMMQYLSEKPNKALNKALTYAPFDENSDEYIIDTTHVDGVQINAKDLLPKNNRNYYTYKGSLTTPPCSEIVDWYVMQKSVGISKQQMETFKKILTDTSPDHYPFNNRPLQDLNDRDIERRNRYRR